MFCQMKTTYNISVILQIIIHTKRKTQENRLKYFSWIQSYKEKSRKRGPHFSFENNHNAPLVICKGLNNSPSHKEGLFLSFYIITCVSCLTVKVKIVGLYVN